jgi:hypothetical protein
LQPTVSRPVPSGYRASLWDPWPDFYLALLTSSDNYFFLLSKAPSLTRKWVCRLQCNHLLIRSLTPNNHILPSHLRLCSPFVASYDSQGLRWKYSIPPPHGVSPLWLEFFLLPTVSRPVSLGIGPPFGTLDQILACSSSFCLTITLFCFHCVLSDERTGL